MKNTRYVLGTVAVILTTLLAPGCVFEAFVFCPTETKPAISIEIRVPDQNAHGDWVGQAVIRDGSYTEVLRVVPAGVSGNEAVFRAEGAPERPGVYNVSVRSAGYEDWTVVGVSAPENERGVETQHLTASLVRKP